MKKEVIKYMMEIGAKGGKSKSESKVKASKESIKKAQMVLKKKRIIEAIHNAAKDPNPEERLLVFFKTDEEILNETNETKLEDIAEVIRKLKKEQK